MHRIRAQIEALEHEGMGEFAKKLTDFLIQKYNNRVDNSSVIDLWRSVMTTYEGYINARYRSLNDVYALIGKIKKETEKIDFAKIFSADKRLMLKAKKLDQIEEKNTPQ